MSKDSKGQTFSDQLNQLSELIEEAIDQTEQKAKQAVDEKPLMTLGITALIFLVIGFLLGKSGRS